VLIATQDRFQNNVVFGRRIELAELSQDFSAGKVPCVVDGDIVVGIAGIMEFLAERHGRCLPRRRPHARGRERGGGDACRIRGIARSLLDELRRAVRLHEFPASLERDIARLGALWNDDCAASRSLSAERRLPRSTPSSGAGGVRIQVMG